MNEGEIDEVLTLKEGFWEKDGIILGIDVGKYQIDNFCSF